MVKYVKYATINFKYNLYETNFYITYSYILNDNWKTCKLIEVSSPSNRYCI